MPKFNITRGQSRRTINMELLLKIIEYKRKVGPGFFFNVDTDYWMCMNWGNIKGKINKWASYVHWDWVFVAAVTHEATPMVSGPCIAHCKVHPIFSRHRIWAHKKPHN